MSYNNYNYSYGGYTAGNNRYYPQYTPQAQPQVQMQPQMQPMYGQQNQVQQPIQQNFAETPIREIRYLNAAEIKPYIVDAGTKSMLIDRENKLVHIKYANSSGESTEKIYSYAEVEKQVEEKNTPQIDLSGFVKKEDLTGFLKADDLKEFSAKLDEKLNNIEKKIKISEFLEGDKK